MIDRDRVEHLTRITGHDSRTVGEATKMASFVNTVRISARLISIKFSIPKRALVKFLKHVKQNTFFLWVSSFMHSVFQNGTDIFSFD